MNKRLDMENQPTPQQLPERVSLPTTTVNEILGIFSQLPFNQVNGIITKIQEEVVPLADAPAQEEPAVEQK